MFQKALTHIDNVSDPSVWMQVGKMYDLIKNNKVGIPEPSMHPVLYQVLITCRATLGQVGNTDHQLVKLGKAGRNRWLGRRPKTRGMAKSHHEHPLGGGEGRSKGGRTPASASGTKSKGGRTRPRGKSSDARILRRRKSKRYGQLKL